MIGHKTYPLEIVDTAGQEEFATMRETYMKEAQGFMLVYSVVDEATVDQLAEFFTQILRVHEDKAVIPLVVVGNKSDLDPKKVSIAEAEAKCRKFLNAAGGEKHTFKVLGMFVFLYIPRTSAHAVNAEASAKTKANVTEAFELLVQKCVEATEGKSGGGGGGDAKGKKKGCVLL